MVTVMRMRLFSGCGEFLFPLFLIGSLFFQECRSSVCIGSTCESCISSSYSCSWCTQKNFKGASRCDLKETLIEAGCQSSLIDNPQGSTRLIENSIVRDSTRTDPKAIQIQPQRVSIKTRPREEHSVPMTFRAANNFPVDLYFLFDNSVSMNKTIRSLGKLADDIGQAIGDISSNYKMGYGVFQDKVILPFTDTSPARLKNPCLGSSQTKCAPPFEFRHLLSMTSNIEAFKGQIHSTNLSGNVDHPEGSLDAIMQSVKCIADVGWRDDSRKLLIFASNGPFKTAGAGKIAGIVMPNDGSCHLNERGEYSWQLKQDYPSISQLIDAVNSHEVHIIFAVTNDQADLFYKLAERVPHSVVEMLADPDKINSDNQNIKEVIEKKYKEMISAVEIIHNNVTGVDVQIRAMSDECKTMGTNKCNGLQIGSKIKFQVDVKVTECPKKPEDRKKQVILHPDFLKKETLVLDIEIICECNCKNDSSTWEVDSGVCTNGNGTLKCGICDCHDDRYGQFCQCDSTDLDSRSSNCRSPESNSTVCNGAGTCKCGVCLCDEGYSGPFCQCNDKACGTYNREICGGARGRCVCGKCKCEEDYEGNTCECPKSNATCIQNGEVCNGVGTCHCGKCECDRKYTGTFCQNCFLCGEDPCDVEIYRACAQCALVDSNSEECLSLGCPPVELVTGLEGIDGGMCSIKQADGCFLQFATEASESNITLYIQRTKTCPQPVSVVPIIGGVVGGVVAVGILLLLLWKILTSAFDKIEYSKFQEELKVCKWARQENPTYIGATTTYKNPMLDTSQPLD